MIFDHILVTVANLHSYKFQFVLAHIVTIKNMNPAIFFSQLDLRMGTTKGER